MEVIMTRKLDAPTPLSAANNPTLLVVEDEVLLRLELAQFLESHGIAVLQASSHADAMRLLGSDWPIDAVVTDIDLGPGPNGLTLAAWLRDHRSDIPVLICSGRLSEIAETRLSAADVFSKPFDPHKLLARIRKVLARRT